MIYGAIKEVVVKSGVKLDKVLKWVGKSAVRDF